PKYALANDLWIGPIPWVLQQLTIPEQLLLALVYPRVFVFKLRPKIGGVMNIESNQRAMRGNVSSYDLDANGIAGMIEGDLLPRPLSILPDLVSVTFIGPGPLPKGWLYSTFKIRRPVVRQAFSVSKAMNPKYFQGIELSEERLSLLPEDGVPEEI
ncbi:hypothetical protein GGF50DRAFT_35151, partial [Schizophyllum commune]